MADKNLSSIIGVGGIQRLAPDLNYVANLSPPITNAGAFLQTGNLDGSSGLVTAISLAGKFSLSALQISNNLTESYTIKLTVDGVPIWNSANTLVTNTNIIGAIATSSATTSINSIEPFVCDSSLLLEFQSTTDTAIRFNYIARPII